jgi:hypothetical protein
LASDARDGGKADTSKVSVRGHLSSCNEHWSRKAVDGSRGWRVGPVEFSGELLRHYHEDHEGVVVEEGEFISVLHGAEPRFVMEEEVRELLSELVFAAGAVDESIVELERI